MTEHEDILQERLERLEAGEDLENCLEQVPEEVALRLKTAAHLYALQWPEASQKRQAGLTEKTLKAMRESMQIQQETLKMNNPLKGKFYLFRNGYRWPLAFATVGVLAACFFVALLSTSLLIANRVGQFALEKSPTQPAEKAPLLAGKSPKRDEPSASRQVVKNPGEAVVLEMYGLVELQNQDAGRSPLQMGSTLSAGGYVRTGLLSSVRLAFYDGSQVLLGPQSELRVDELQAQTENKARVVVLTQLLGQSEHTVAASTNPDSRYEVQTAAATGTARGTRFKVGVSPDQQVLFSVSEGKVDVTGQDITVQVESGHATTASLDDPPAEPLYYFSGQGEVSFMLDEWVVEGQILTMHPGTVVIGSPQVGDEVFFEGRLLPDNVRLVDLVVLIRRSPLNRFSLTGVVTEIVDGFWTVNGQQIAVTDITFQEAGILMNDLVQIEGRIMSDGTMQAEAIRRLEEAPGLLFDFAGVVQETGADFWRVSDVQVAITGRTVISGTFTPGSLVRVTGWILESNRWEAATIEEAVDETRSFEFTGKIETTDPWMVAGVSFETGEWTVFDEGLEEGVQVRVKGRVMDDGTWVADEIRRLDDLTQVRIILIGTVTGMDPWVVSGMTLNVDPLTTVIDGQVGLGMLVQVEIDVLEDGTWQVVRIEPLETFELVEGCREVSAVVASVSGNQVQLVGWPLLTLGEGAQVIGELQANSVVLVQICAGEDGTPQIVYIYLILQPEVVEMPDPELPGEKVQICHKPNSKNPHIIVVSQSAVPAHLGHGDFVGTCP